ncbi:Uridine nucleosidase 1 [Sesamum angolense]|uniref:Uridine nucleosidase 1 n=1 Tax=Sesamum angolense TaxID=2727404 RepID=A0AAE1WF07_9LAMI|nr:Uridine nucleosidase 1 [Sesamum angolense]
MEVPDISFAKKPEKIIIDTDPALLLDLRFSMPALQLAIFNVSEIYVGLLFDIYADDSMAILMAFQSPDVEILGLTTIFGNVTTDDATRNALLLCEIAGRPDVPVAEGSSEPLKVKRVGKTTYFCSDVLMGSLSSPKSEKSDLSSEVLCITNLALAVKRDSSFASKVKRVVILGGAFFALGNVTPAAEANIYGDPEAADIVFTSGANIDVVGINITTQVQLTDTHLDELRRSEGKHAQLICDMCKFYRDWHVKSDGVYGIFLHDPVSFALLVRPDLFTFKKGVVRVETQGICVGHTLMDQGLKTWNSSNPWSDYSPVSVAWTVNVEQVLCFVKENLMSLIVSVFIEQQY